MKKKTTRLYLVQQKLSCLTLCDGCHYHDHSKTCPHHANGLPKCMVNANAKWHKNYMIFKEAAK